MITTSIVCILLCVNKLKKLIIVDVIRKDRPRSLSDGDSITLGENLMS